MQEQNGAGGGSEAREDVDLPFYKKQFTLEKLNSCPHSILFVPRAQQVCSFSLACYCMFLFYFWICPWVYPSKNTGVGCHFLLQGISLTQG